MVVLFYGSQTGTAEDLAIRTQNDISSKLEIPCVVLDPDEYEMEELQEWTSFGPDRTWIIGFFMATYGEGEPTDNCTDFYTHLFRKDCFLLLILLVLELQFLGLAIQVIEFFALWVQLIRTENLS
jgi:sulfite reductase alpha subunit-like flavoprotein